MLQDRQSHWIHVNCGACKDQSHAFVVIVFLPLFPTSRGVDLMQCNANRWRVIYTFCRRIIPPRGYPSMPAETIVYAGLLKDHLDWIGEHSTCEL